MSLNDCEVAIKSQPLKVWADQETGAYAFEFRITLPKNVQVDEIMMSVVRPTFTEMAALQDYTTVRFRLPETKTVIDGMQVIDLSYSDRVGHNGGAYRIPFIFVITDKTGYEVTYTCISETITVFRDQDPKLREKTQECFFRHWLTRGQAFRLWAERESYRLGQEYSFINDTMLKFNSQSLKFIVGVENKLLKLYFDSITGDDHTLDNFWNYSQNIMVNKVLEKQWYVSMQEQIVHALEKRSGNRRTPETPQQPETPRRTERRRTERSRTEQPRTERPRAEQPRPERSRPERTRTERPRTERPAKPERPVKPERTVRPERSTRPTQKEPDLRTEAEKREHRRNVQKECRDNLDDIHRMRASRPRRSEVGEDRPENVRPARQHRKTPAPNPMEPTYTSYIPSPIPGHVPPYIPPVDPTYNPAYDPGYNTTNDPAYNTGYDPAYDASYNLAYGSSYESSTDSAYDSAYDPGYAPPNPRVVNVEPRYMQPPHAPHPPPSHHRRHY